MFLNYNGTVHILVKFPSCQKYHSRRKYSRPVRNVNFCRHKKESIELIDLTITEDANIDTRKSITEFGGSPTEDRTLQTKGIEFFVFIKNNMILPYLYSNGNTALWYSG
jgi:hypothetical protein